MDAIENSGIIMLDGKMDKAISNTIMALPESRWNKDSHSSVRQQRSQIQFGRGSEQYHQIPSASVHVQHFEKRLISFFKNKADITFTSMVIIRYETGQEMGAHVDTNNTPGNPWQICAVVASSLVVHLPHWTKTALYRRSYTLVCTC